MTNETKKYEDADVARWLVQSVRASLDAAHRLNLLGMLLCAVAMFWTSVSVVTISGAVIPRWLLLIVALMTGIAQAVLLVRIAIDQRLFAGLAESFSLASLPALDRALIVMGWKSEDSPFQTLVERCQRTGRFLRWAAVLALIQGAALLLPWVWAVLMTFSLFQ